MLRNSRAGHRLSGYVVDLSESHNLDVQAEVERQLDAALSTRAVIEQAKGALMSTYSIDDAVAWSLLRWQSQEHNVKVRELASWLVEDMTKRRHIPAQGAQEVTHLFLTLTERPHSD